MWRCRLALYALTILALVLAPLSPAAAQDSSTAGVVYGIVTFQNSVPVEAAEVSLESVGSTTTNSRGQFIFRDVSPGNYRLTVQKSGLPGHSRRVMVRPGRPEGMTIALDGYLDPQVYLDRIRVPLHRAGNALFVKAILNERHEVYFHLDTGASITTISTAVANALGIYFGPGSLVRTFATASGTIRAPLSTVSSIQVGDMEARDVVVAVHDLPYAGQVAGLLGLSFLSRFRFTINPQDGYMVLNR